MITNLKCKNCGYEIGLAKSWDRIEFYHTGVEENMLPNRFCHMVRKKVRNKKSNKVAELSDDDMQELKRYIIKR